MHHLEKFAPNLLRHLASPGNCQRVFRASSKSFLHSFVVPPINHDMHTSCQCSYFTRCAVPCKVRSLFSSCDSQPTMQTNKAALKVSSQNIRHYKLWWFLAVMWACQPSYFSTFYVVICYRECILLWLKINFIWQPDLVLSQIYIFFNLYVFDLFVFLHFQRSIHLCCSLITSNYLLL